MKNVLLFVFFVMLGASAFAAPGVSATGIRIGMSLPLSGPEASQGSALRTGAELYLQHTNATGGVNGRSVTLTVLDDAGDPKRTQINVRQLIEKTDVFAMLQLHGITSTEAALPLLEASRTPLIGTTNGSAALRENRSRLVFNTRASYQREVGALITQLDYLQLAKVSVVVETSPWGLEGAEAIKTELIRFAIRPDEIVQLNVENPDVREALSRLIKANSQAIVFMAGHHVVARIIKGLHEKDLYPQCLITSGTSLSQVRLALGINDATGLGVSQVVPHPQSGAIALTREYQALIKKYGGHEASYAGLEGFVSAKVLVTGLRKAGQDISRTRLIEVLESAQIDLGGFLISYTPTNHNGSNFSDVAVVSSNNQLLH